MALSIVSCLIGIVLVWLALRALRKGTLTLPGGGQTLKRGQSAYWLLVVTLFAAGVGAVVTGVSGLQVWLDPDPGPMRSVEGPGFRIDVPSSWQEAEAEGDMAAMSFSHPHGELLLLFPPPAKVAAGGLEAFAEGARDPAIRYQRFDKKLDSSGKGGRLQIDMRYPSPRGEVIGRLIASLDAEGKLRSVHALCTFEGSNAALCERIVSSLVVP
ncbi:MAG TPA: hypothetical protein VFB62_06695 [Polyangiaceae bacterium]|jgi:hypothetical protein|nr:hypothetical protein [Polyangiaceae bacterium]